ncbi:MAG: OPT family oligopeptide transporter [candidate division NC10 bacterium]|nr:OPT family oligopeptide transporter [candidate division NC10 bacterium]
MDEERKKEEKSDEFSGIDTAGKTSLQIELEWFEGHYRGDIPQLTVRAVLIGAVLGGVMSLSNLYVGLKTGWGLGVAISACILSFSIGAALKKIGVLRTNLSILENNCMQSTASSAGYSTGATMVSAISALLMIRNGHLPFWTLLLWTIFLAILGVILAIPMKRQMINLEQLKFPSGLAAAQTLRSLYAKGKEATKKARSLAISGVLGASVAFARDNIYSWWPNLLKMPGRMDFPGMIAGQRLMQWTIGWDMSLIMIAAGAIIGIRVAWSMLLAGWFNYGYLAPLMYRKGVIEELGYRGIVFWSLWGGTAIMLTSGLLTFVFQWRTIGRAFSGLQKILNPGEAKVQDQRIAAMEQIEVPGTWFLSGLAVATIGVVSIQVISFSIHWWMGVISVLMTFFLALVACRAAGETDITPVGAMGKITQLFYGVVAPGNMTTNLMTACVTAGAAASSADLLTDLKSGYLLGANPRKQFIAQFLGIFTGALVIVPAFYLLVPTPGVLGGDTFPAPAAQVWKGVAELLSKGLSSLDITERWALAIGGSVGILISILERLLPAKARPFIPSAMGIGLSFVIPFWNSLSMFVGALFAWILARESREIGKRYTVPVASGLIAGESLMGVLIALLIASGIMR